MMVIDPSAFWPWVAELNAHINLKNRAFPLIVSVTVTKTISTFPNTRRPSGTVLYVRREDDCNEVSTMANKTASRLLLYDTGAV